MRILFMPAVKLSYEQKQNCSNQYQPAFAGFDQPFISGGFNMPYIGKNNYYINSVMTKLFDNAFATGDTSAFLAAVNNSKLKPIFDNNTNIAYSTSFVPNNDSIRFPINSATVTSGDLSFTVNKSGHTQIYYGPNGEHLFLKVTDLSASVTMDAVGKSIIAGGGGGMRCFDPFDQNDWPVAWPTAEETRAPEGVANLTFDNSKKGVFINTPPLVGQTYKTHPRALVLNEGNSIIFACQQEVYNSKTKFGAWSILPFRIKEGKKAVAVFPINEESIQKFKDSNAEEFNEIRKSGQWSIFDNNKKNFFMVDASKPSTKSDLLSSATDWGVFGTEGDDFVWVIRSCFEDNESEKMFKIYSECEAGGGTKYTELEFIAPRVKAGEKSTLVYRLDKVSLKEMGLPTLTKENMDKILKLAASIIEDKIALLRKIAA